MLSLLDHVQTKAGDLCLARGLEKDRGSGTAEGNMKCAPRLDLPAKYHGAPLPARQCPVLLERLIKAHRCLLPGDVQCREIAVGRTNRSPSLDQQQQQLVVVAVACPEGLRAGEI